MKIGQAEGQKMNHRNEIIINEQEIPKKIRQIFASVSHTLHKLQSIHKCDDLLFRGTFSKLGSQWDDPEQPESMENQFQKCMTILTSYYAVDWFCKQLMTKTKPDFTVRYDDKGADILFETEKSVYFCQCFAADSPYDKNKIFQEMKLLAGKTCSDNRYFMRCIIFCSPERLNTNKRSCKRKGIEIIAFNDRYVCTDISCKIADAENIQLRIIHVSPRELQAWAEQKQGYPFPYVTYGNNLPK